MKRLIILVLLLLASATVFAAPRLTGFEIEKICIAENSHAGQYVLEVHGCASFASRTDQPQISAICYQFTDKASGKLFYSFTREYRIKQQMLDKSRQSDYVDRIPLEDFFREDLTQGMDFECRAFVFRKNKEIARSQAYQYHHEPHVADPGKVELLYGPANLGLIFSGFTSRDGAKLHYSAEVYYPDRTPVEFINALGHESEKYVMGRKTRESVIIPMFDKKGKGYSMDFDQVFYVRPLVTDRFGRVMWRGEMMPACFKESTLTYDNPQIRVSGDHLVFSAENLRADNIYTGVQRSLYMDVQLFDSKDAIYVNLNGVRKLAYATSNYIGTTDTFSQDFHYPGRVEIWYPLEMIYSMGGDAVECRYRLGLYIANNSQYEYSLADRLQPLVLDNIQGLRAASERKRQKDEEAAARKKRNQENLNEYARKMLSSLEKESETIFMCCAQTRGLSQKELENYWVFFVASEETGGFEELDFLNLNPVQARDKAYQQLKKISGEFNAFRSTHSVPYEIVSKFSSVYQRAENEYQNNVAREIALIKK